MPIATFPARCHPYKRMAMATTPFHLTPPPAHHRCCCRYCLLPLPLLPLLLLLLLLFMPQLTCV